MDMNYGHPHEKLGEAIRALMLPATQGGHGRIIAGAIHEFTLVFKNREVDRIIQQYVDQINAIMKGSGTWEDRANALSESDLRDLVRAFWELDRAVSRAYHAGEV